MLSEFIVDVVMSVTNLYAKVTDWRLTCGLLASSCTFCCAVFHLSAVQIAGRRSSSGSSKKETSTSFVRIGTTTQKVR